MPTPTGNVLDFVLSIGHSSHFKELTAHRNNHGGWTRLYAISKSKKHMWTGLETTHRTPPTAPGG